MESLRIVDTYLKTGHVPNEWYMAGPSLLRSRYARSFGGRSLHLNLEMLINKSLTRSTF